MKERVTLTVDKNILKEVDQRVDGYKIKNRSHAVELLLLQALGSNKPKKALILAGGKGTRFRPLTEEIPKPLIPIHGKPLIVYTIELFKKYDIRDIIIAVGYKADQIKQELGNGSKYGVKITYIEEKKPLGTAGPLKLAQQLLTDTFVACNADEIKEIDLIDMYLFHKEKNAEVTIALTTVKDPTAFGVARVKGSQILEFLEKPKNPPTNLINSGLYIMEPTVLEKIPAGFAMLEKDVFPKVAGEGKLYGYSFAGYWQDVGDFQKYQKVLDDLKKGKFKP